MNKANNTGEWQTVDKEAILIANGIPSPTYRDTDSYHALHKSFSKAMDEYAASQNRSYIKQEEQYLATINEQSIRYTQLQSSNEAKDREIAELKEVLSQCEEYFDNKADADHDGENFIPNKEMQILSQIRNIKK